MSVVGTDHSMGPRGPEQRIQPGKPLPMVLQERATGWELGLPAAVQSVPFNPPVILAVGGGKGGVGKSLVSANLAVRLGLAGRKTVAIDMDVGGANLHTYFGLEAPARSLADALVLEKFKFEDILLPTIVPEVQVVAGGREEEWGGTDAIDDLAQARLMQWIMGLRQTSGVEFVVLDLGAGTHPLTIDMFLMAHLGLVTVLPEPTSIENAYSFMKALTFRLITHVGRRLRADETADEVKASLLRKETGALRRSGYAQKLRQAGQMYPGFINGVESAMAGRVTGLTLNQIRSQKDIDIGRSMELIGEQYFGLNTRFCGYLNHDEAAWKSLRNRRLLVADFPHSIIARRFADLARVVSAHVGY